MISLSDLDTEYAGRKAPLFRLVLGASVLTVLTLGFYRFWMKTRLRRYYWSAIRPGGLSLEYVGRGSEKLLGFLIAVVFLAFYIGIVNLILVFFSFSVLDGPGAAYAMSFVGIIPLVFFARYRARRYILARTRWRGIRMGLEPGAWGYSWRAMMHWTLAILTLGVLWPRATFWLEKYRTDRTWFGDLRLTQGGRWTMLYRPFRHFLVPWIVSLAVVAAALAGGDLRLLLLLVLTVPWTIFGIFHYLVQSFRILAEAKTADGVEFKAAPRTGRIIGIYALGLTLAYSSTTALVAVAGVLLFALFNLSGLPHDLLTEMFSRVTVAGWLMAAASIVAYFAIFIAYGAFYQIFVTMPVIGHYAETLTIGGRARLNKVRQRRRDEFAEADGFAEALDLGAAI